MFLWYSLVEVITNKEFSSLLSYEIELFGKVFGFNFNFFDPLLSNCMKMVWTIVIAYLGHGVLVAHFFAALFLILIPNRLIVWLECAQCSCDALNRNSIYGAEPS